MVKSLHDNTFSRVPRVEFDATESRPDLPRLNIVDNEKEPIHISSLTSKNRMFGKEKLLTRRRAAGFHFSLDIRNGSPFASHRSRCSRCLTTL